MMPNEVEASVRLGGICSTGKCSAQPTHRTSYRYVTGRAGRIQTAERAVCIAHAQRFAAKHNLEIGEPQAQQVTASQAAISAALAGPPR